MSIYRPQNSRSFTNTHEKINLSNQVVFSGTDEFLSVPKGTFMLELLQVSGSGSVTIKDGDGNTIATGVKDFSNDHSPLRCDKGLSFTGDVQFAKGYVVENCFE